MDAGRLADVLSSSGLSEFEDELASRLDQLNTFAGSAIDKKALLNLLKDAGCTKMGVRQKLATVLMCELSSARPAAQEAPAASTEDFWGSMIQQSHVLGGGDAFDDLPPPSSAAADAALLSNPKAPPAAAAVAPLPAAVLAEKKATAVAAAAEKKAKDALDISDAPLMTGGQAAQLLGKEAKPTATGAPAPAPASAPPTAAAPGAPAAAAAATAAATAAAAAAATPPPPPPPPPPAGEESGSSLAEEQANLFRKLGDEALSRKDRAGAERWFTQALAATPYSSALLLRLASCALGANPPDHAGAVRQLARVAELPATHVATDDAVAARLQLAKSSLELGRLEQSVAHYDACLALQGHAADSPAVAAYLAKPSTPSEAAEYAKNSSLPERAKAAADGRVAAAYVLDASKRAKQMAIEGRVLEALQASRIVRQHCGACCDGTLLAVDALERQGRLGEAVDSAREGVERTPHDPTMRVVYARLLSRKGSHALAEIELEKLVEGKKSGKTAYASAPEFAEGYARAEACLEALRAAKKLKDDGNTAYGASQFERAITCYTKGMQADTEGFLAAVLHGNRSQAYAKLGQLKYCLDDCHAAIQIDDEAIKMRLRRAACRRELNQPDEAVLDYERVLELDPENAGALAGMERAEEVASGTDGRKGGMIDFEGERLDPYEVLDLPKDCNAIQIKAAFRKLALIWHPDKHEGEDDAAKAYAVSQFKRIRVAHQVLSNPSERSRLDEEGSIAVGKGSEGKVKPFHEYYSINTPEGYTRGGCFVSTRRYDPMVGAVDARGSICAAEKMSRRAIKQQEEAIRLKGPEEAKRLLAPGESPNSNDQYNKFWDKQEERRIQLHGSSSMKEEKANHQNFFGKRDYQPKQIAQTRYLPLEVEHRDSVQRELMKGTGVMKKLGHAEETYIH